MPKDIVGRGWSFPIAINPQGGLSLTDENSEIVQAIRIILMTAPGQRVMRPTFGCRLHELVFAPNNVATATLAQRYVEEALKMWEPRINVVNIVVGPEPDQPHVLMIRIEYQVKATRDRRSLVYPFYLIPEETA
ncbi:MAG: GPW/gp25 family protein [Ardenticatenaceae bacterium]|nr:GPW/gp25 family protein [Ardenticatenaceae bacterium]